MCDELAASPYDNDRPAGIVGVEYAKLDRAKAEAPCRAAHEAAPNNLRIDYQLARLLDKFRRTGQTKSDVFIATPQRLPMQPR